MSIITIDNMLFLEGKDPGIVVESGRVREYTEYIIRKRITSVYLCNLFFRENNIDFFENIDFVERVNVTSSEIKSFQGLQYLKNLTTLSIDEPGGKVDLTRNRTLKELSITMNKNVIGLEMLHNLEILRLWKYAPKSKSLAELSALSLLEELVITGSSMESLQGCNAFRNLRKLELNYLRKMQRIDELEHLSNSLKELSFNSCKNIVNHGYVTCLNNLEKLSFNACGEMDSIDFITKMQHLKWFVFMDTNVRDGNMAPCKGLEYVAFTNKKHFSHKMEELSWILKN